MVLGEISIRLVRTYDLPNIVKCLF